MEEPLLPLFVVVVVDVVVVAMGNVGSVFNDWKNLK